MVVGIIHLFGNIWKLILFRHGIRWRLIFGFGVAGVVSSFLGASLVFTFPKVVLLGGVGVFFMVCLLCMVLCYSFLHRFLVRGVLNIFHRKNFVT